MSRRLAWLRVLGVAAALLGAGCASLQQSAALRPAAGAGPSFDDAMHEVAHQLAGQLRGYAGADGNAPDQPASPRLIVLVDSFVDAENGYATNAGQNMQDQVASRLSRALKNARFAPLSSHALSLAHLVMAGSFELQPHAGERGYRLQVSLTDLRTGLVAAQAASWLVDRDLDMTALPVYQDSPVFVADRYVRGMVATTRTPAGRPADPVYFSQLSTQGLLAEAQGAFDQGDYVRALALYQRAQLRPDGKSLRTYSGLYVTHMRLGQSAEAEKVFADLLAAAFAADNLSIRVLFQVNSTDFINDARLSQQYRMWLRHLARYLPHARACVDILGHSSRTGRERYNDRLSTQRAEAVQRLMQQEAARTLHHTRTVGRGFRDTLVGSGTDDARDAVDRRVDFKVAPCGPQSELSAAATPMRRVRTP